jgi:UDP-glucuronate decarboxylase
MTSILITGGAGFVASMLAEKLASNKNYHIVIVDNLLTGERSKIPVEDNVTFIEMDVNERDDLTPVFAKYKFDYVFHYAAMVGVLRTLANPVGVLHDVTGIKNILDLSKAHDVKRVFYASSSEVYGEPVEFPQNEETTPLNSRLPYAIVKNIGEAYLRSYQQEYGLPFTIFRFFNTYGIKQSRDFVVSKFLKAAMNDEDITIYGDGSQSRTFCFVDDNVDACVAAFEENKHINDVLIIGSTIETSVLTLAETIIALTNSKSTIKHIDPLEDGDMTRRLPDNHKMLALLNRPLVPLEVGIKTIIAAPQYILD